MESIEKFAIEIDYSECEKLYDYGACEWVDPSVNVYGQNYPAEVSWEDLLTNY